jgi:hypothetical protein
MKFFIPGVTIDKTKSLEGMAGDGRFIAFRDLHDNTYLVGEMMSDWGTTINGCSVFYEAQLTTKNGYTVTVEWDGTMMPACLAPAAATAMVQDFKA